MSRPKCKNFMNTPTSEAGVRQQMAAALEISIPNGVAMRMSPPQPFGHGTQKLSANN